ncbi:MAG: altronate dehydratase [Anaerolineae bacterium]|nr:altronate dehydratase [Anaerolineae bacterium]
MPAILEPLFQIHPEDSVAITLVDLYPGMQVSHAGKTYTIQAHIPTGHKLALHDIPAGETVVRYGYGIGTALTPISAGDWVHTHNLVIQNFERDFAVKGVRPAEKNQRKGDQAFFDGYLRPDGRVGTRNYVAILSTVNCVNPVVRHIQRSVINDVLQRYPNVDGVLAITHDSGCSIPTDGLDHENLRRVLSNIAAHPNLGGCLAIGLGCEVNQMEETFTSKGVPFLSVQAEGGTPATVKTACQILEALLETANNNQRTPQPLASLRIALQCGGSDAFSGITGNPLLGEVSDRICAENGSVVIAETTEIFGAEHLLLQRAENPRVAEKLRAILSWWQDYSKRLGVTVDNNPSPGNKAGGLTTIFEKSLGAISKCGTTPLRDVLEYGEISHASGVGFMDSPGNDAVSLTGQLAAGCNLVLFTTGRGTTYAPGLAPCLKVATTSAIFEHMRTDMDINAGNLLEGQSLREAGDALLATIIATASGQMTKSETFADAQVELVPWRRGAIV